MAHPKSHVPLPIKKSRFRQQHLTGTDVLKILTKGAFIYGGVALTGFAAIRFIKSRLSEWIGDSFGLPNMNRVTRFLNEQTDFFQSGLSFSSPGTWGSYLSALSASTAANAKLSVLKTVSNSLEWILSACLTGAMILGGVILCFKYINYCKKRFNRRAATYEIISELMPVLNEINTKLDKLSEKKDT